MILIGIKTTDDQEMKEWVHDNQIESKFMNEWPFTNSETNTCRYFVFFNAEDAIMFRLKFGL